MKITNSCGVLPTPRVLSYLLHGTAGASLWQSIAEQSSLPAIPVAHNTLEKIAGLRPNLNVRKSSVQRFNAWLEAEHGIKPNPIYFNQLELEYDFVPFGAIEFSTALPLIVEIWPELTFTHARLLELIRRDARYVNDAYQSTACPLAREKAIFSSDNWPLLLSNFKPEPTRHPTNRSRAILSREQTHELALRSFLYLIVIWDAEHTSKIEKTHVTNGALSHGLFGSLINDCINGERQDVLDAFWHRLRLTLAGNQVIDDTWQALASSIEKAFVVAESSDPDNARRTLNKYRSGENTLSMEKLEKYLSHVFPKDDINVNLWLARYAATRIIYPLSAHHTADARLAPATLDQVLNLYSAFYQENVNLLAQVSSAPAEI
jgi:hypothetical protein